MKDKNYCTMYVVRHGETDWNVLDLIQGQTDTMLTKNGEIQAKEAARELGKIHFDAVFSSDLIRARRTAEIISLEKKIAVQTTKLLCERNYGSLQGKSHSTLKEIDKLYDALKEEERFSFKPFPDVESDEEVVGRFITFAREVAVANAGKTILVVAHGGLMRIFLMHLRFANFKKSAVKTISNGGYVKLKTDGVDFFVEETVGIKKD